MNEFSDPSPIATTKEFKDALLAVHDKHGITPKQLRMLRAHLRAAKHTINTTKLASAIGYSDCSSAHLLYGKFAHRVADALHRKPGPFSTGKPHWWRTLAYGNDDGTPLTNDGLYEWVMRPELVQALQEMKLAVELPEPTANQKELDEKTKQLLATPLIETPSGQKSPKKVEAKTYSYERDPSVRAYVLRSADGHCELCNKLAPFETGDGTPFLEVHHVKSLADGGSDRIQNAVAVCPNCHRSLHQANDSEKRRKKLYRNVKRLKRE